MNDETRANIIRVINTLEQITVAGSGNMDKLLGCILHLRKMVNESDAQSGDAQPEIHIEPVTP